MIEDRSEKAVADPYEVLKRDLAILESMAVGMGEYLASDATWWDMGRRDMPLLTIGGYLMRRRRLDVLDYLLATPERITMAAANAIYDNAAGTQLVRFEERALAELGARMREWTDYLRNLAVSQRLAADRERYEYLADTRVVVNELISTLGESPFRLPAHIPADVAALDHRLGSRWKSGAFIWSSVWAAAYPPDKYWFLYGYPKAS